MCKTLIIIGCIIVGAGLLDWYDRWHLVIGLPLLVVGMVIYLWLGQRLRNPDEGEANEILDDTEGTSRQVMAGVLCGGMAVGLLAVAFAVASWTGLAVAWLDPDCSVPLRDVSILAEGQAHARIIEVVDAQLRQPTGAACRQALREHKARALWALAGQLPGKERLHKLQQAREEAEAIPHRDLVQAIAGEQQAEIQKAAVVELQAKIEKREEDIRALLEERKIIVRETEHGVEVPLPDDRLVLFAPGQAELQPTALAILKDIAALLHLAAYKERRVHVEGHTDASGSANQNQGLSEERAKRVADVLAREGVRQERLIVRGYGKDRPIADNDSKAGRAQNRRVSIIIEHAQKR